MFAFMEVLFLVVLAVIGNFCLGRSCQCWVFSNISAGVVLLQIFSSGLGPLMCLYSIGLLAVVRTKKVLFCVAYLKSSPIRNSSCMRKMPTTILRCTRFTSSSSLPWEAFTWYQTPFALASFCPDDVVLLSRLGSYMLTPRYRRVSAVSPIRVFSLLTQWTFADSLWFLVSLNLAKLAVLVPGNFCLSLLLLRFFSSQFFVLVAENGVGTIHAFLLILALTPLFTLYSSTRPMSVNHAYSIPFLFPFSGAPGFLMRVFFLAGSSGSALSAWSWSLQGIRS